MYLDTYGNEAINGWDGTALYTGSEPDGKKQYVFAPQVGAGTKDSQNRFTGVVMGKDSGQDKVGLYGYQEGVNTFGLMEDGIAFFGASSGGGRIKINGKSGFIKGGGLDDLVFLSFCGAFRNGYANDRRLRSVVISAFNNLTLNCFPCIFGDPVVFRNICCIGEQRGRH